MVDEGLRRTIKDTKKPGERAWNVVRFSGLAMAMGQVASNLRKSADGKGFS
jgi:hypothetical protein